MLLRVEYLGTVVIVLKLGQIIVNIIKFQTIPSPVKKRVLKVFLFSSLLREHFLVNICNKASE